MGKFPFKPILIGKMALWGIDPPFLPRLQVGRPGNASYGTSRRDSIKSIKGPGHVNLRRRLLAKSTIFVSSENLQGRGVGVAGVAVTLWGGGLVQLFRKPRCGTILLRRVLPEASCCVDCGSANEVQPLQPWRSPFGGLLKSWQDACPFPMLPLHFEAAFLGPVLCVSRTGSCTPGSPLPTTPHTPVPVTYLN